MAARRNRMNYRTLGRTGLKVSEIGYGAWGIGAKQWIGATDDESARALDRSIDLGLNFIDTALAYGDGHSEQVVGQVVRRRKEKVFVATKIPPKNRTWPARDHYALDEVFPADYVREYTEISLKNLGIQTMDLQQFHVWTDAWAADDRWQRAVAELKEQGLVRAIGISINRWQPANVLRALATGLIDAVQVVYNVFDQAPEDELFPECQRRNIAVIARVPFDEGSLTDTLTPETRWPEGDFRNIYFGGGNLENTLPRVAALRPLVPAGMTMPELALRHILEHPAVSTVIPGMRKLRHVEANLAASDGRRLPSSLVRELRGHRWDRWIDIP